MAEYFPSRNNLLIGISVVVGAAGGIYLLTKSVNFFSQLAERRQRKKRAEDPCNVCCKNLDLDNIKSQLAERRQRKKRAEDPCNVCCKNLDLDNIKSSIKCVNCQKPACRGQSCSVWIPSRSGWECHLCNQSHESISKSSEWLNQQVAGRYLSPLSARSEPALLRDHLSPIEPDRRSEATSSFHGDQKERVREMIEETLGEMLGGSLDNISVNQLYKSRKYLPTWENGEEPGMSHIKLKRLIEKIINDTLRLPNFTNEPLTPGPTSDQTLPFFDPKKYQELLATAVLNKIVDSYNYEQKFDSNRDAATDCSDLDRNHNALIGRKVQSGSISSSSIEPESDSSITDPLTNVSRFGDFSRSDSSSNLYTDAFNRNEQRDSSMLTDYLAKHNVPLPDFSIDTDSSNEDNLSESKNLDDSWEGNWLFKKKRMGQDASCPVGMLVPCPKEDIKTQIGDKTADELSDLSEAGSDCEDNNNIDEIEDTPPNALIQNRNIIGGKSPLGFFDELLEQTSLVSVSSVAEGDSVFTETKNEYVLGDDLEHDLAEFHTKEAINSFVDTQKIQNKLSDAKNPEKQVAAPNAGKKPEAKPRSIQKPPVYVNVKEIPESDLTSSSAASSATITESASESLTNDPNTSINNTNNNNPEEDEIARSTLPENVLKKIQCSKASAIQFLAVVALAPSTAIPIVDTIHFDSIVQTTEKFVRQVEAETEETENDPEVNLVDVETISPPEYMKEMQNPDGQDVFIPPPYEFSSESEVSSECENSMNISRVVKTKGSRFAREGSEVLVREKQAFHSPENDSIVLEARTEVNQSVLGTAVNVIENEKTCDIEANERDKEKFVESRQSELICKSVKNLNTDMNQSLCENCIPTENLEFISMSLKAELYTSSHLVVDDNSKETKNDNSILAEVEEIIKQSSDELKNVSVEKCIDSNEAGIQNVLLTEIRSDSKHSDMLDITEESQPIIDNNNTQEPAQEIKELETLDAFTSDVILEENGSNEVSLAEVIDAKRQTLDLVEKSSNENQLSSKDFYANQLSSKPNDYLQESTGGDLKGVISTTECNLVVSDTIETSAELLENVNPDSDSCNVSSGNTAVGVDIVDNVTVDCEDATADDNANATIEFTKKEIFADDCHEKALKGKCVEESIQKVLDHKEIINSEVLEERSMHLIKVDVDVIESVGESLDSCPNKEANHSDETLKPEVSKSSECLLNEEASPIDNVIHSSKERETKLVSVSDTDVIAVHVPETPTSTDHMGEIFCEQDDKTLPSESLSLDVNCCDSIVSTPSKENTTVTSMNTSEKQIDKSRAGEEKLVPTNNNEIKVGEISDVAEQEAENLPVLQKNETSCPTDSENCSQIALDSSLEVQREDNLKKDNLVVQNNCSTYAEVEEFFTDSIINKVEMAETSDAGKSFKNDSFADSKEKSASDIAVYSKFDEPKIGAYIASVIPVIDEVSREGAVTSDETTSVIEKVVAVIDKVPTANDETDQLSNESLPSNTVFSANDIKAELNSEHDDLTNNLQLLSLEEVANSTEKADEVKTLQISSPLQDIERVEPGAEDAIQNDIQKEVVEQIIDEILKTSSLLPIEEDSTNINQENVFIEKLSPSSANTITYVESKQDEKTSFELITTESELISIVSNSYSTGNECDKVLNFPDSGLVVEEKVVPPTNESTDKAQDNFLLENEEPPDTMVSSDLHLISTNEISDAAQHSKESGSHVDAFENENVNAYQIPLELSENTLKSVEETCDLLENILPPIDFQINDEQDFDEDAGISSSVIAKPSFVLTESSAPESIPLSTMGLELVSPGVTDEMATTETLTVSGETLEKSEYVAKNPATCTEENLSASPETSVPVEILSAAAEKSAPAETSPLVEMSAPAEMSARAEMSASLEILSPSEEPALALTTSDCLSTSIEPEAVEEQKSIKIESSAAKPVTEITQPAPTEREFSLPMISPVFEECGLNLGEVTSVRQECQKMSPKISSDFKENEPVLEKPVTEAKKLSVAPEHHVAAPIENKSTLVESRLTSLELPQASGELVKATAEPSIVLAESVRICGIEVIPLQESIQAFEEPAIVFVECVPVPKDQKPITAETSIDHIELTPGGTTSATLTTKPELDSIVVTPDLTGRASFAEETLVVPAECISHTISVASESDESAKPDPVVMEPVSAHEVASIVSTEFTPIASMYAQSTLGLISSTGELVKITEESAPISKEPAPVTKEAKALSVETVSVVFELANSDVDTETLTADTNESKPCITQTGHVAKHALISDELSAVSADPSLIIKELISVAKNPDLFFMEPDFTPAKPATDLPISSAFLPTPTNNETNSVEYLSADLKNAESAVNSACVSTDIIECIAQQDYLLARSISTTREQSKISVEFEPVNIEYKENSTDITPNTLLAESNQADLAKLASTDEQSTQVSALSNTDPEVISTESVPVVAESKPGTIETISKLGDTPIVSANSSSVVVEIDLPASETETPATTEPPCTNDASVLTKPSSMVETVSMESVPDFTENDETLAELSKDLELTETTVNIISNFAEPISCAAAIVASAEPTHISTEYKHIFEEFSRAPVNFIETAEPKRDTVQTTVTSEISATDLEISASSIGKASVDTIEYAPISSENVLNSEVSLSASAERKLAIEEPQSVSEESASTHVKLEPVAQESTILTAEPEFVLSEPEPAMKISDSTSDETTSDIAESMIAAAKYTLSTTQGEIVAEGLSAIESVSPFEMPIIFPDEIASSVEESILEPLSDCEKCQFTVVEPADVGCMSDVASALGDYVQMAAELESTFDKHSSDTTGVVPKITIEPPENDELDIYEVEPQMASDDLTVVALENQPVLEERDSEELLKESEDIYSKPKSSLEALVVSAEPTTIPVASELITTESKASHAEFAAATDSESVVEQLKGATSDVKSVTTESFCSTTVEPESYLSVSASESDEPFRVTTQNEAIHDELCLHRAETELVTAQSVSMQKESCDVLAELEEEERKVKSELATDKVPKAENELREINEVQILPDLNLNEAFESSSGDATAISDIESSTSEFDIPLTLPSGTKLESNIVLPGDFPDSALNVLTIEASLEHVKQNKMESEIILDEALTKYESQSVLEKSENIGEIISAIDCVGGLKTDEEAPESIIIPYTANTPNKSCAEIGSNEFSIQAFADKTAHESPSMCENNISKTDLVETITTEPIIDNIHVIVSEPSAKINASTIDFVGQCQSEMAAIRVHDIVKSDDAVKLTAVGATKHSTNLIPGTIDTISMAEEEKMKVKESSAANAAEYVVQESTDCIEVKSDDSLEIKEYHELIETSEQTGISTEYAVNNHQIRKPTDKSSESVHNGVELNTDSNSDEISGKEAIVDLATSITSKCVKIAQSASISETALEVSASILQKQEFVSSEYPETEKQNASSPNNFMENEVLAKPESVEVKSPDEPSDVSRDLELPSTQLALNSSEVGLTVKEDPTQIRPEPDAIVAEAAIVLAEKANTAVEPEAVIEKCTSINLAESTIASTESLQNATKTSLIDQTPVTDIPIISLQTEQKELENILQRNIKHPEGMLERDLSKPDELLKEPLDTKTNIIDSNIAADKQILIKTLSNDLNVQTNQEKNVSSKTVGISTTMPANSEADSQLIFVQSLLVEAVIEKVIEEKLLTAASQGLQATAEISSDEKSRTENETESVGGSKEITTEKEADTHPSSGSKELHCEENAAVESIYKNFPIVIVEPVDASKMEPMIALNDYSSTEDISTYETAPSSLEPSGCSPLESLTDFELNQKNGISSDYPDKFSTRPESEILPAHELNTDLDLIEHIEKSTGSADDIEHLDRGIGESIFDSPENIQVINNLTLETSINVKESNNCAQRPEPATLDIDLLDSDHTDVHDHSEESVELNFSSRHSSENTLLQKCSSAASVLSNFESGTKGLSQSNEEVILNGAAPAPVPEETVSSAMESEVSALSVADATCVPETLKLAENYLPTTAENISVSAKPKQFFQHSSSPYGEIKVMSPESVLISNKRNPNPPTLSSISNEVLENSPKLTPVPAESESFVGRPLSDTTESTPAVASSESLPRELTLESAGSKSVCQQLAQEIEQPNMQLISNENTTMQNFAEGCEDSLTVVNEGSAANSISTSPFKFNADAIIEELIQQIDYSTSPLYNIEDADYSIFENPDYEPINSLPWHCLVDEIQDINEIESDSTTENSEPDPELSITPPEIAMCYMTTTVLEPIPEDVELLETQPPNTPPKSVLLDDNSSLKKQCHEKFTPDESSTICVTTTKTQEFEKLQTNPENETNLNTTQQEDMHLSSHSLNTTETISDCDHIQNTDTECTSAESSTLPTDKHTSTESSSTTTTTTSVETVRTAIEIPLDGQKTRASALHEKESHKDSKISPTTSPLKKPFSVSIAFEVKDAPTNTTNLPEQIEQAVTQTETRDSNGLLTEIPPINSSTIQDTVISNDDTANPGDRHYTKVKLLKNTAFSRRLSDDEDDVQVGHLHNLLPGSIAEREHKKWYNAVEMPNNPYSKEALKRRLSTTSERPIDIPNINSPLEKATSEDQVNRSEEEHDIANDTKQVEYRRYGRDYYINDAKYASGSSKQSKLTQSLSLHGLNVDADQSSVKEQTLQSQQQLSSSLSSLSRSHSWGDKHSKIVSSVGGNGSVNIGGGSRSSSCDIFTARPVRVEESDPILSKATKLEYLSTAERDFYLLPTEEISSLRSISASEHSLSQAGDSLTPSEDSDTIRVYDLKTQQTRLIREDDSVSSVPAVKELIDTNTTRAHRQQQRGQSPANLLLTQRSLHPTSNVNRGSTPTAFRFLQPKRKLYDSRRVMSEDMAAVYDREHLSRSNGTPEKSVIEEDVIPALPSVKALTKVFQNTSQDGGVQMNRPKSYSWKSVDIKSKEELTPTTQEATPTTAQSPSPIYEETKSEPEPSNHSYPPSYDQKYIPAENPVVPPICDEQDKHTESTPVTPVTGSRSPQLVTFAENNTEEPVQPSKADNLIDLTTMSQPVEDIPKEELQSPAEPCKDSYSPPYDQQYIPAEAPVVSPVAVETEEKPAEVKSDESNSLEWKEDNVEIIATPKSDQQATPPNTPDAQESESVLTPESEAPVVEVTSSLLDTKEERTNVFIQTTDTRESTIVEKFIENEKRASIPPATAPAPVQSEATPENDDIRIIPLKPTEAADESVVNPVAETDTASSIESVSAAISEEAPVSSSALETAPTTPAAETLPIAAEESISVEVTSLSLNHTSTEQPEDEKPAVSSPEPPAATTNGLAVDTKPAENGFHEASPVSPNQEEQNETSKQTVAEQKRSEIRFTQEQPLQNRPISPVLVPGKLKSSIAFFENLKNKK